MLIFCLFIADVIGNAYDVKCVLCQTYQVIISVTCNDETAAPNTCVLCERALSTTKTSSSMVTDLGTQHLIHSFDFTFLPTDGYSLIDNLWQIWVHQSDSNQAQSLPQQQVVSLSSSQRCKRT